MIRIKIQLWHLWVITLLTLWSRVDAHTPEDWPRAFYGGQVQTAGDYHLEVVLADDEVALYVYDLHNQPLALDTLRATVLIWGRGNTISGEFKPDGPNRFVVFGDFKLLYVQRVIVKLQREGAPLVQAWFKWTTKVPATEK